MRTLVSRTSATLVLVATLALGASTAAAHPDGPTLDVSNPGPGDRLIPGSIVIQGLAYDDTAEQGTGVDRVSVYLGDRNWGGQFLGDATLGLRSPQSVEGGDPQFAAAGWRLATPALKGGGEQRDLLVYARSSVSGAETVVSIPVVMGETIRLDSGGAAGQGGAGAGGGD